MIQILVIVLCLVPRMVFAWNDGVHMMIALIAKQHLQPGVLSKIENLTEDVDGEFPLSFDFVEAAYWMNRVSRRGCGLFDSWHDEVIVPLNEAVATLSNLKSGAWEKNFCLRVLMYCIGNLHHPFCQERTLQSTCEVWDSLFGTFASGYSGSFEEDEEIKKNVCEINMKISFNDFFDKRQRTFEDWAEQSSQLARMVLGEPITSEYNRRCTEIALRQIAIAGCHLADVLNEIFDRY